MSPLCKLPGPALLVAASATAVGCDSSSGSSRALEQLFEACRSRDGAALYEMAGPAFRHNVAAQARRASSIDPKALAELYGYPKPIAELTPERFLGLTLHSKAEEQNPCWRSDEWRQVREAKGGAERTVIYELPTGRVRAVVLRRIDSEWKVEKITPSLTPDKLK